MALLTLSISQHIGLSAQDQDYDDVSVIFWCKEEHELYLTILFYFFSASGLVKDS